MANFTLDQTGQEIQDILDTVGNNEATQGQVLTADGNGGASWQNASGEKIYLHNIQGSATDTYIFIRIISKNNTAFTINTLLEYIYNNYGTHWIQATGYTKFQNNYRSIIAIRTSSISQIYILYLDIGSNAQGNSSFTGFNTITDTVTEL